MVQIFGDSMSHTPWYRFPFMRFISLYFDVCIMNSENFGVLTQIYIGSFQRSRNREG